MSFFGKLFGRRETRKSSDDPSMDLPEEKRNRNKEPSRVGGKEDEKSEQQKQNREKRKSDEAKKAEAKRNRTFVMRDGVLVEEYDAPNEIVKYQPVIWENPLPPLQVENTEPRLIEQSNEHGEVLPAKRYPIEGSRVLGGNTKRIEAPRPDWSGDRKTHRVVIADITRIVDRYAQTLAEKKIHENIEKSGWNLLKKAVYRLAEDGYTDEKVGKYFLEAKQEILNNRNLLSLIETKLARKSEGVALRAGDEDIHYEILDSIIDTLEKGRLDETTKAREVKAEHVDLGAAQNARIDAAAADLVVKWCLGEIADHKTFDEVVEKNIVPLLEKSGAKQGEGRMYANNLLSMAEGYKKDVFAKLAAVGQEFGPDQKMQAQEYIRRTLHLDIFLAEKGADLYQKSSSDKMKGYEKYVDWVQKGTVLSSNVIGGKASRVVGRVLSNPLLYAAGGSMLTRSAARSAGMAVGTGIGFATGIAFAPATLAIVGSGVAAGWYLRARGARERRRDIERRQQETVMGLREGNQAEGVKVDQWRAEKLIKELEYLQTKADQLTLAEKQYIGQIGARVELQAKQGVDLIGITKETHEKFRSKVVVENNLRKAIKDLWEKKGDQYGATPAEQLAGRNRFENEAIPQIVAEIKDTNQEQAEQIRKYANKVGLVGGGMAMAGAALSPYVLQIAKEGLNNFVGTHFDVSKVTYFEELGHKIKEWTGHGHPDGVYAGALYDQAPRGVNVKINLPPGFSTIDQGMDGSNHLVAIVDSRGNIVPGADHLAFDTNGNLANPRALETLHHNGWQTRTEAGVAGRPGSSGAYTEAELRADGFDKTVRADWHHIRDWDTAKKILFNGKELQAYKTVATDGDEKWDVAKMLGNLSDNAEHADLLRDKFGIDTTGHIDAQLQGLKDQMVEWFKRGAEAAVRSGGDPSEGGKAEIAKHLFMRVIATEHDNKVTGLSKVIGAFDEHGHLVNPAKYAHAAYKEIGLRDDSGHFHMLATDKTGTEMMHGPTGAIGGKEAVLDLYSPTPHGTEVGFAAGYKRETDKQLDREKKQRENEKRAAEEARQKAIADKLAREQGVKHKKEVEQAENYKKAKEEIIGKLDSNQFNEKVFNESAQKYGVNKEDLAQSILEAKGIDHQAKKDEALKAAQEAGITTPTNLELYLLMLKMFQAEKSAKGKSDKVVNIEAGKKQAEQEPSASEIDLDTGPDYDDAEERKVARVKIFSKKGLEAKPKEKPKNGVKAEKAHGTDLKNKAEEAKKPGSKSKEKVAELGKIQAERRAKINEEMLRNFSKSYDISGVKLSTAQSFKEEFDKKPSASNELILDKLAGVLRNVKARMKDKMPSNINIILSASGNVSKDPIRVNSYHIPFNHILLGETSQALAKLLEKSANKKKVQKAS